jgi:hypothetical protein
MILPSNYNGTPVTHIKALSYHNVNGVEIDPTSNFGTGIYGIDHYCDQGVREDWWQIALDNGWADIPTPDDFPPPQFAEERLRSHKRFNQRRVIVIDTTATTINQMKALVEMDEIIIKHLTFNRRASDDLTTRMAIQIRITFDENGDVVYPNWVTNNYPDKITHLLTVHEALELIRNNNTFQLTNDITLDDITIQLSNGTVTGTQAYNYLKRIV